MKAATMTVFLLLVLAMASARIPRNDAERQHEEDRRRKQQESGVHTYYILLKPTAGANARRDDNNKAHVDKLAEDFHKRLGDDSKVTVVAASKVQIYASPRCTDSLFVFKVQIFLNSLRASCAVLLSSSSLAQLPTCADWVHAGEIGYEDKGR